MLQKSPGLRTGDEEDEENLGGVRPDFEFFSKDVASCKTPGQKFFLRKQKKSCMFCFVLFYRKLE